MRKNKTSPMRRWISASVVALIVATGGGAAVALTSYKATAQVTVAPSAPISFADLVEAVKPAVVSVNVQGSETVPGMGNRPNFNFDFPDLPPDHPFRRFFDQFGDQFGNGNGTQQRPNIRKFQAAGSGFVISADGYVVTNNHVVDHADKLSVTMDNGDEHTATLIGTDPRTDLALIKIDGVDNLTFVQFADTEARVGDWVVAVGNPFGLGGTVTAGIVSARGRDISGSATGDFLQIDAAVNRGNSGGPTFNLEGKVAGVNTAIFSPNGGSVGIAFAIPASIAKQIVDDLKAHGHVTRGFLGVSIQDVTKDIADSVGLPTARGALVTEPTADSPAAVAGIKSGDVIVEVDGEPIDNALDLSRTIGAKAPDSVVDVVIWRSGQKIDVKVTLVALDEAKLAANDQSQVQPPAEVTPAPVESSVGVVLVPNADGAGVLVQDVNPDSTAAAKGLAVGDIILEADNQTISSASDFENAITAVKDSGRSTVLIKASRNGAVRFIGLPLNNQ